MTTIVKDKALMMEEIRKLISEGRTATFTVKGNSMNPFIVHLRDQITMGPWQDEDIRKGCVALVRDTKGNYCVLKVCLAEPAALLPAPPPKRWWMWLVAIR